MKTATAIKKFMTERGYNPDMYYPPASVSEIKELKDASTPEEWDVFGKWACNAMGETFEK